MKLTFYLCGGGDRSVGIEDTHATITLEDNLISKYSKDELDFIKQQIANIYEDSEIKASDVITEAENLQERIFWLKEENDYLKADKPRGYKTKLIKNKKKEKEILKLIELEKQKYEVL